LLTVVIPITVAVIMRDMLDSPHVVSMDSVFSETKITLAAI